MKKIRRKGESRRKGDEEEMRKKKKRERLRLFCEVVGFFLFPVCLKTETGFAINPSPDPDFQTRCHLKCYSTLDFHFPKAALTLTSDLFPP